MRCFALLLAAGVGLGSVSQARSQDTAQTTFDFDMPGADQSGAYAPGAGAEVAASLARIAARAGWVDRAQSVRVQVDVDHPNAALDRAVLSVDVADLPVELRSASAIDGRDVTASATDGTAWDRPVASGVSMPSGRGLYHVRVPTLPMGASSFYLYAGDRAGAAMVDELTFFTDPTPTVRSFVTGGFGATDIQIVSMVAGNDVVLAGMTETLGEQEGRNRTGAALGAEIVSAGPIAAAWIGAGGDSLPFESLAGTDFIIPSPRYDEAVYVVTPFGAASVTFTRPSAVGTVMVPASTSQRIATLVGDFSPLVFSSDVPIVVVRGSDSGDVTPFPPSATELIGVVSGTVRLAAGASAANVVYHRSDGTNAAVTVPANSSVSLSPTGQSQGSGVAIRILSDAPVGAVTYGDADGGEMIAFLPPEMLGHDFLVPLGAQFVPVATALPNTTCRLIRPDGSEFASDTSGAFAVPVPGKIYFGSTTNGFNVPAPSLLRCDGAAWAAFEDASSETEKLLLPAATHRPFVDASVTVAGAAETRFDAAQVYVDTPDFVPPRPATGIVTLTATETAAFGGTIGYQVSLDGGSTWMVPDRGALVAASMGETAAADAFAGVAFDAPTNAIRFRVWLDSDGLADPAVDDLTLEVDLVPPPVRFAFEPVASPQNVGTPFTAVITAVDASDALVPITGDVEVTGVPAGIVDPVTAPLTDGRVEVMVTPLVGAAAASLVARQGDLSGGSNEFEIVSASDTLQIRVSSGDGQVGPPNTPLPEPLVVQITDATGAPLEGLTVDFAIGSSPDGGGALSATTSVTDADGLASVSLTLGEAGDYSVVATLAADDTLSVAFGATAMEEGGCDCRATVGRSRRPAPLGALLLLAGVVLYRRRLSRQR